MKERSSQNFTMTLKGIGLYAIVFSTIIALILSMTANMEGAELGALFNFLVPSFAGLIAILLYLFVSWLSKDKIVGIVTIAIFCSYLIYVGIFFHFQKGYLPFPFE